MFTRASIVIVIFGSFFHVSAFADQILSLDEAESLAIRSDPGRLRFESQASALREQAVADAQLPDPRISVGLLNFPVDTFDRDQEPMTQIQFGVEQKFPKGDSLAIKSAKRKIGAMAATYRGEDRQLQLLKQVRLVWLELFYWQRAEEVIKQNQRVFKQLVTATQNNYAVGRGQQQDVLHAQLEASRLDDRLLSILDQQEQAAAELSVLTGLVITDFSLPASLPEMGPLPSRAEIEGRLQKHPMLQIAASEIEKSHKDVALARESYKPEWMLGVRYGFRDGNNNNGSERADFVSVGVSLDVPLFKNKRQDRVLQASQQQLSASKNLLDQRYLELQQKLRKAYANWKALEQRDSIYQLKLIPQAGQQTEATLFAYQNDRSDFTSLMRSRITSLDTQLKAMRIHVNRAKAAARILYFVGELS
jgi:outer membrane protein TolC